MYYKKWIDEKIYWLTAVMSVNNDIFQKNLSSIAELYRYFESGKTEDAQKAVNLISKNLSIVPPNLHYDWSGELDHNLNIKGQMSKGQLTISLTFTLSKFALAATVVHELMHYFLIYRKNITLPDNLDNEKITDLSAIVLGFGKIMLNGKVINFEKQKINTLGYLSLEEIAYAFKKISALRNVNDFAYLTYDANRIIDGTIRYNDNFTSRKGLLDGNIDLKFFKEPFIFLWQLILKLSRLIKRSIIFLHKTFMNLLHSLQRKSCPFCHKNIERNSIVCKFCKRTLRETA